MDGMLEWSAGLPETTCARGAVLIHSGEAHGRMYVLVDGAMEVIRDGTRITVVDTPGAVFGEMSALLGGAATATVRALRDSRLRRSDEPLAFLDAHPAVTRAVATMLARRLETMTGYLLDLRRQYGDRDTLAMVDTVLDSLRHDLPADLEPGSERQPDAPY